MYAFFRVDGVNDSLALCKRWCRSGLGLAPGIAFGPGRRRLRALVLRRSEERLADGVERLRRALAPQAVHR